VIFQVLRAASMKVTALWALRLVISYKQTDVLEVLTASIIRAVKLISFVMKAVSTSKTQVYFYETTRAISQKDVIFMSKINIHPETTPHKT
jgi:hypothetical protein